MVSAEVTHTVDRRNDVILGDLALSLRHRLRCLHAVKCVLPGGNLPTPLQFPSGGKLHSHQRLLQSLLFGEEGIALDIIGLSVDIPHQIQLGPLFDSVLLQVASLVTILQKTFTGWHAGDDRHWTYFTRLAPTGFALRCDLQELGTMSGSTHPRPELDTARAPSRNPVPCIPHIWLQCREAKLCVADDPLETWLSKVWHLPECLLVRLLSNVVLCTIRSKPSCGLIFGVEGLPASRSSQLPVQSIPYARYVSLLHHVV